VTRYSVSHRTSYRYGQPVTDAYSVACLLPRDRPHQRVIESTVTATPAPDEYDESKDVFGNRIVQLGIHHRHDAFDIVARSVVDVDQIELPTSQYTWEQVAEFARALRGSEAVRIGPYRAATPASTPVRRPELLAAMAQRIFTPGRPVVDAVSALSTDIFATFAFDPTATDWATPIDDVLEQERGVCQDFAHVATAVLRHVGIPASYVSGYIETEPPPGEAKSIGADASHAWCSVWIPDVGWFDLDPTNDQVPPTRHVTVGWGRDYADVAPVRGVVLGPSAQQTMQVGVDVARVDAPI
jgi:transglutaminase-like putative cysteine protease